MKIDARLLVRLYPRAWRERYGEELVALLDETDFGVGSMLDVLSAAVREHLKPVSNLAGPVPRMYLRFALLDFVVPTAVTCLLGWAASIAASLLFEHYRLLPSFQTTFSGTVPQLAYPPSILKEIPTFHWLPLIGMARAVLAYASHKLEWRWPLRVSAVELVAWSIAFCLTATSQQLYGFIGNGHPGFPFVSSYDAWESSTLSFAGAYLWLAAATPWALRRRDQIVETRRRPAPPSNILGLNA